MQAPGFFIAASDGSPVGVGRTPDAAARAAAATLAPVLARRGRRVEVAIDVLPCTARAYAAVQLLLAGEFRCHAHLELGAAGLVDVSAEAEPCLAGVA